MRLLAPVASMPIHAAGVVLGEAPRRGLVVDGDAARHGLGVGGERLHQGEAAAGRRHAGRALGDEVVGQEVERDAEAGEPAQRRAGVVGERRDQLGIDEAEAAQEPGPFVVGPDAVPDHGGVEVAACVLGEALQEILGDLVVALHAPEGFGVAGVAAALLPGRALQQRHAGTGLLGADGGRQARDAAAHHDHVVAVVSACHASASPALCRRIPPFAAGRPAI